MVSDRSFSSKSSIIACRFCDRFMFVSWPRNSQCPSANDRCRAWSSPSFSDVQDAHGVMGRTFQNPQGVLRALIRHRAVQGIEDVVGIGLRRWVTMARQTGCWRCRS